MNFCRAPVCLKASPTSVKIHSVVTSGPGGCRLIATARASAGGGAVCILPGFRDEITDGRKSVELFVSSPGYVAPKGLTFDANCGSGG